MPNLLLAVALALPTPYLQLDATIAPTGGAAEVFEQAAQRAGSCPWKETKAEEHVRCLLDALNGDRPIQVGGDGRLSTLLVDRRGDPYSLAAAILLLHGGRENLEAVVFGSHVLLAIRQDHARYFEPQESGREMTIGLAFATHGLPFSRGEHADVDRYLAYYADRLAVTHSEEPLFRLAVQNASRSARIRYDYGAWLHRQNRLDEAREELEKSTSLGPDDIDAWIERGTVLTKLDRLKPARRCFAQVLRLEPGHKIAADKVRSLDAKIAAREEQERQEGL